MNRRTARENTFILLFEAACKTDEAAEEIYEKAVSFRELECDDYVKRVFFGVRENLKAIDEAIEKNLQGWNKERISFTSTAALRLAVYELMFMDDVPPKVSINEAIELSKKYDDEKAYMLVNGVLNGVAEYLGRK